MLSGGPTEAYDAIVACGERQLEPVGELRRAFAARTGAFQPEDPWFEVRSRAFWDDAITRRGFARIVEGELAEAHRAWIPAFERAHRGLFRATRLGSVRVVVDVWSGAEFVLHVVDPGVRDALDALDANASLFDARIVARAAPLCIAMLPGAVFHPADAAEAIERVLARARSTSLDAETALDALLRMEHSLRALSRVKAGYAYRAEALPAPGRTSPHVRPTD